MCHSFLALTNTLQKQTHSSKILLNLTTRFCFSFQHWVINTYFRSNQQNRIGTTKHAHEWKILHYKKPVVRLLCRCSHSYPIHFINMNIYNTRNNFDLYSWFHHLKYQPKIYLILLNTKKATTKKYSYKSLVSLVALFLN